MTPALTVNSLLALVVPAAALLVAAAVPPEQRIRLWWAIWAFAVGSAFFCLLQFVAGPRSLFYLYRITNEGSLVGLFSNRNHNALLLSLGILSAGWLAANEIASRNARPLVVPMLFGSIGLFLLLALIVGSRFGLVGSIGSLLLVFMLVRWSYRFAPKPINQARGRARRDTAPSAPSLRPRRMVLNLVPLAIVAGLAALFYYSGRDNTVGRLLDGDGVEEIRLAALGTVTNLVESLWLLGSGFGSFASVYQIAEPDALLRQDYFNHAHSDWLQLPIEGGLPAILIFAGGAIWAVSRFAAMIANRARPVGVEFVELVVLAAAFGLIALNSLFDYPLRTPSLAMIAAILAVILARRSGGGSEMAKRG